MKEREVENVAANVKQASWVIQKIIRASNYLTEADISIEETLNADSYSIRNYLKETVMQ